MKDLPIPITENNSDILRRMQCTISSYLGIINKFNLITIV